jgi:hypothetical protein
MIRPEAIALTRTPPPGGAFPGTVAERFFLGNLVDYRIAMEDGSVLAAQLPAGGGFAPGERVHVVPAAGRAWLVRDDVA